MRALRPLLLALILLGCSHSHQPTVTPPPDDGSGGGNHNPPPITAAIALDPPGDTLQVGEARTFNEVLNTEGVIRVEWDLNYDGTTFDIDRSIDSPTVGKEPAKVIFGTIGDRTVAMRAIYPNRVVSPLATAIVHVTPQVDPDRFRANQQDISDLDFQSPIYTSPYTSLISPGGHALACNGNTLLAGYYALEPGDEHYYLVASNDLGASWGKPSIMSNDPANKPFLNRSPSIAIIAHRDDFIVTWVPADSHSSQVARAHVNSANSPSAAIGTSVDFTFGFQFTQVSQPLVLVNPADETQLIFFATALGFQNQPSEFTIGFLANGTGIYPAHSELVGPGQFGAISSYDAIWVGPTPIMAFDYAELGSSGGSGGTQVTHRLIVKTMGPQPPPKSWTPAAEFSTLFDSRQGAVANVSPYYPVIAATPTRYILAWQGEDGTSVTAGDYGNAQVQPGPVSTLLNDPNVANFDLVWTGVGPMLLYTIPGVPDPAITTNHSEQLYGLYCDPTTLTISQRDLMVNTDDPDVNESHVMPSVIAGPNGEALTVWVGAKFNQHDYGRFSFNRTG